jgi:hypothetical protein
LLFLLVLLAVFVSAYSVFWGGFVHCDVGTRPYPNPEGRFLSINSTSIVFDTSDDPSAMGFYVVAVVLDKHVSLSISGWRSYQLPRTTAYVVSDKGFSAMECSTGGGGGGGAGLFGVGGSLARRLLHSPRGRLGSADRQSYRLRRPACVSRCVASAGCLRLVEGRSPGRPATHLRLPLAFPAGRLYFSRRRRLLLRPSCSSRGFGLRGSLRARRRGGLAPREAFRLQRHVCGEEVRLCRLPSPA